MAEDLAGNLANYKLQLQQVCALTFFYRLERSVLFSGQW